MMAERDCGAARRRRERRARQHRRFEQLTLQMALSAALHHSRDGGETDVLQRTSTATYCSSSRAHLRALVFACRFLLLLLIAETQVDVPSPIDASVDQNLEQMSEEEGVDEEMVQEVQPSRFQGLYCPRRRCPNLFRGSQCHYGARCTFAYAFHELEAWRD